MLPDFSVKRIHYQNSKDTLSQLFTLSILLSGVVYFLVTRGWQQTNPVGVILVSCLVVSLLVVLRIPRVKNIEFFNSGGTAGLIVYNITIYTFLIWYAPFWSPLVFLVPPVFFYNIYYRGNRAFIVSVALLIGAVIASTIIHGYPNMPYGHDYPYFIISLGIGFGGVINQAGKMEAKIRGEFVKVSKQVEQERNQLESLINSMSDAVIAVDAAWHVVFYNVAATRLLGFEQTQLQQSLASIVKFFNSQNQPIVLGSLLPAGYKFASSRNLHFLNKDNEKIDLAIDISAIKSQYEEDQHGFIVLLRDITKQKTLDNERDEFIAITSDEIRNPIAAAEASVSLAVNEKVVGQLSPKLKEVLDKAREEIHLLSDLAKQLGLLSQIEIGKKQFQTELINPNDLLSELANEYEPKAAAKNLQLKVLQFDTTASLSANKEAVKEILSNYISNAIKYTDSGYVDISCKLSDDRNSMIFAVQDSGSGIGQSDRDKIFQKYFRSEDYRTKQVKGTGLGLYIVSKIAELINAKVWFDSEPGKGSTFYLSVATKSDVQLAAQATELVQKTSVSS